MLRPALVALALGLASTQAPAASLCGALDVRPLVKHTGRAWTPATTMHAPVAGEIASCELKSGVRDSIRVRVLVEASPSAPQKSRWQQAVPVKALWPDAWYTDTVSALPTQVQAANVVGAVLYAGGRVYVVDGVPVARSDKNARKIVVDWLKAISPR